jgi:hypothetical protein
MHKTPELTENETVIEYFSSKHIHDARKKKAFRRTLIVVVLTGAKILTVLYFGLGDLFESNDAAAHVPVPHLVAPFAR